MNRPRCWGLLLLIGFAGCQSQTPPPPADGEAAATVDAGISSGAVLKASNGLRLRSDVVGFPGNWVLIVSQPEPTRSGQPAYRDLHLALLEIKEGLNGLDVAVLGTMPLGQDQRIDFTIREFRVEDKKCHLTLVANNNVLRFEGTLGDDLVRGALSMSGSPASPAALRPTLESTYDAQAWDPMPLSAGAEILGRAVQQKDVFHAILAAAKELRGHPLAMEAYGGVFARLGMFPDVAEEDVRKAAKDYVADAALWGDAMVNQARLNVAVTAAASRKFPQAALEFLDEAEASLDETTKAALIDNLNAARSQARVDVGLNKLKDSDATEQARGYELLQEQLATHRYNTEVLEALGRYAADHDQPDTAIEHFADIVALPLLEATWQQAQAGKPPGDPTPRDRLLTLWEAKHGSVEGFDAFLDESYKKRLAEIGAEVRKTAAAKPEVAGSHSVLIELFTGTACPPCVAADVALEIVEHDFPPPQVVAVRYHQHIPGPDPLVSQDSEDRYGYYQGPGTPHTLIDGGPLPPPGAGGFLQHVGRSHTVLHNAVLERLKVTNEVNLTASASAANGELAIAVEATGWPEAKAKKLRLRIALVEREVTFTAPNGIRHHAHVVREMIGGPKGAGVKAGKLASTVTVPLAEVRQRLVDYLQQFEANRKYQFTSKPLALAPLSVVAWVQDEETQEVLQTALVPVDGDVSIPGVAPEAAATATTSEAASALIPANASSK